MSAVLITITINLDPGSQTSPWLSDSAGLPGGTATGNGGQQGLFCWAEGGREGEGWCHWLEINNCGGEGREGHQGPLGLIGNARVPLGIVNRRYDTLQQSYHLESIILMFTLLTFFPIQRTLPISNVLDLELTPWLINFTKFSLRSAEQGSCAGLLFIRIPSSLGEIIWCVRLLLLTDELYAYQQNYSDFFWWIFDWTSFTW